MPQVKCVLNPINIRLSQAENEYILNHFDPCDGCDMPCHRACPRDAFRSGAFERDLCKLENDKRESDAELLDGSIMGIEEASKVIKPYRFCELACPIAQVTPHGA